MKNYIVNNDLVIHGVEDEVEAYDAYIEIKEPDRGELTFSDVAIVEYYGDLF